MNKNYIFLSGLPRSGSTILANILAQNPFFHATETSGCMDVLFGIRNRWESLVEHRAHPCPERLRNVLKASFDAYYADIKKPVIISKSRGYLAYIELMEMILERKMKIIVPIRPVQEILTSFEILYRETSKVRQPPGEAENYFQFQTVRGRCDYWLRNDQVVGLSLNRLEDVIRRGYGDRLHFVKFEELTHHPKKTMEGIYQFLEEGYFDHDFDHVEQTTEENDDVHGFVNLHKIRKKVAPVPSQAERILGKDIADDLKKRF